MKTPLAIGTLSLLVACAGSGSPGIDEFSPTKAAAGNGGTGGVAQIMLCRDQLGDFADSLQELDSRLSVGLVFTAYTERVGDVRVEYDRLPIGEFQPVCLRNAGIPLENALQSYVKAYTRWNRCIGNYGCSTESIESTLQGYWADATRDVTKAVRYLNSV